jgi:hypothetical protein
MGLNFVIIFILAIYTVKLRYLQYFLLTKTFYFDNGYTID